MTMQSEMYFVPLAKRKQKGVVYTNVYVGLGLYRQAQIKRTRDPERGNIIQWYTASIPAAL